MAKRIKIIGNSIIVQDTISTVIEMDEPSKDIYFDNKQLNSGYIMFTQKDGSRKIDSTIGNKIDIDDAVNENDVGFTEDTFRLFMQSDAISVKSYSDYYSEIVLGNISGVSIMNAMGERESMGTTASGEDIWRGTEAVIPTPSAAGEQRTLVSSNDADNGATATGILTLRLEYLDDTGLEQTEDIELDGTTPVNTVATNIRFLNDVYALTVGSNGVAEGQIDIYKTGSPTVIYNMIALGGNKSLVPNRMIPLGKNLILKSWHAEEAQNKRVNFRIRSTDMNGVLIPLVFCFKDTAYLKASTSGDVPLNYLIPELSMIKVSGWSSLSGAEGSCSWWGELVTI